MISLRLSAHSAVAHQGHDDGRSGIALPCMRRLERDGSTRNCQHGSRPRLLKCSYSVSNISMHFRILRSAIHVLPWARSRSQRRQDAFPAFNAHTERHMYSTSTRRRTMRSWQARNTTTMSSNKSTKRRRASTPTMPWSSQPWRRCLSNFKLHGLIMK